VSSQFTLDAVDDVIHGRLRLGVMAWLSAVEDSDFGQLKQKTGATDGNLSVQLSKLESAGYIAIEKHFVGKKPRTSVSLTDVGRAAFVEYLQNMQRLIEQASTDMGKESSQK